VLTIREFCSRLNMLRDKMRSEADTDLI